jgi:hypothetical protein
MKQFFQTASLTLLTISFIFSSCRKPQCETCPPNPPTSNTNKSPIAVAGPDQTITVPTDSILLDGSASNDPGGRITAWQWTKISGPSSFNIVNANSVQSPATNLAEGIYQFELTVTDSLGLFDKDTTTVTVNKIYASERIFSEQRWGFNYIWLIFIPDLYTHLPAGTSFKVFIKRDNTNIWEEIVSQWTVNHEYGFDIDNGDLWIYSFSGNDENDTPDIKIIY